MPRFVLKTLVCVLLAASALQGDGITTNDVRVRITGYGCEKLTDLYLVINGDDLRARWVPLDDDKGAGKCHWKTDLGGDSISTSIATFSLRAGPMRSGCKRAGADENRLRANIEFAYSGNGEFRNVSVKTVPSMQVRYVRYVHPFAEDRNPIPCREFATLDDGEGSIRNAKFKGEDVYFDFGRFKPKSQSLGLLLNYLDDGPLLLTLDGVVFRLTVQRVKAQVRSAPTLSSNAMSIDIKKLADLKFEHAEFQVIK